VTVVWRRAPFAKISLDFFPGLRWKISPMTRHPPKLLQIVGIPLICVAFFALAGGHWAVLQAVAWAQMLRDYSKSAPIAEAIAKTFSGDYPCGMCTKITEERQKEERAPAAVNFDQKAEVFLVLAPDILKKPESKDFSYLNSGEIAPVERSEAPPVPVPILA